MKKTAIILSSLFCILFLNINCFADTEDRLNDVLSQKIHSHQTPPSKNTIAMIYGGQDVSHSQIAIAEEPAWALRKENPVG